MTEANEKPDLKWVILGAMGHRKIGGVYYIENGLHRVDIPDTSPGAPPDRFIRTEYYGSPAIFCITLVSEEAARLVAERLADLRVRDAMVHEVICVDVSTPLRDVARELLKHRIHRVVVTEGENLSGIVSALDLVQLIAEGKA